VDTYKSGVAERALDLGAQSINDPMGLTADPLLAKSAAKYNAALILNHTRGKPETWAKQAPLQDPLATVLRDLEAAVNRARHSGCEPASIALDPGLGFGKRKEESVLLISGLALMQQLNLPLHLGPSRKSFLAQATPEDALMATAAAVTACILNGAHIVRVHDVARMRAVVQVADTLVRAQ
jgi:dihydropteroate synthase